MARYAHPTGPAFAPVQRKALIAWTGSELSIPAGYARLDGSTVNGVVLPNFTGYSPIIADSDYGAVSNAEGLGNDVLNFNTFTSEGTNLHNHVISGVTVEYDDGGVHSHQAGNLQHGDSWKKWTMNYNNNAGYSSSGSGLTVANNNSTENSSNGPAIIGGTINDGAETAHTHSWDFNPTITSIGGDHAHDITGGDDETAPARTTIIWITWVGFF